MIAPLDCLFDAPLDCLFDAKEKTCLQHPENYHPHPKTTTKEFTGTAAKKGNPRLFFIKPYFPKSQPVLFCELLSPKKNPASK
jgi:hypothetical protein